MIKKIKGSLTIKIFLLITVLLIVASGLTCAGIARFLPAYYSSQLERDLDVISQEMAETVSAYARLEDAFSVLELFAARSQVSVTILDAQGEVVWPLSDAETVVEESVVVSDGVIQQYTGSDTALEEVSGQAEAAWENAEISDSVIQQYTGSDTALEEVSGQAEAAWESVRVSDGAIQQYTGSDMVSEDVSVQVDAQEEGYEASYANTNSAVKHYDLHIGKEDYTMLVSGGMQPVDQAMDILHRIFPYILAIAAGIAVVLSLAASFYLTLPIVHLSRTSRRMAALDFEGGYQGKRMDEIGVLGGSLNALAANLSRTLEELRQANTKLISDIELERAQERKRIEFFSAVSHELKTPITILKGHLSGMLQGVGEYLDKDQYLKRSLKTTEKMESMVQELLTISRMENHAFSMMRTDVAELMRQQLADMTELAEQKGLHLSVDMPERLMAQVNAQAMEKVFGNLLMNAVRYTPANEENEIRVIMKEVSGERTFYCSVENTGACLPEEDIPHLFEAFYRVEQSRNRQTGGSGLGLYIVRMALERHGAQYGIRNTRDGVEFLFLM